MKNNKPNLFHFATSELSQDAFLCWFLAWATCEEPEYAGLRKSAQYFFQKLTQGKISEVSQVEIKRQYKNIDVLVRVNNQYAIVIEDKTDTIHHSGQLERYYQHILEEYPAEAIFLVYLKTGDQGNYSHVVEAGYYPFLRGDFLDVLEFAEKQGVDHPILVDFYDFLLDRELAFQSYQVLFPQNWTGESWKGFLNSLLPFLPGGDWGYVAQRDGGFFGYWWGWKRGEFQSAHYEIYLQIEQERLAIKLHVPDREKAEVVREYIRPIIFDHAQKHGLSIVQSGRLGKYMTLAIFEKGYLRLDESGLFDKKVTLETLESIQQFWDSLTDF